MDLNQFSTVDIVLDKANDNFIQKQTISAGDRDGRSLTLQVTDAGSIGEVPGLTANLLWTNHSSGVSDLSAFSVVDRTTSVFRFIYPQNMLTAGKVTAQIQLLHNGKVTLSKKFEIIVLDIAGKLKGVLQSAEYTALVEALAMTNEFETDIAEVSAQLAQKATQDALNAEKSRIDNLITLPEGATTNDARLEDIRISANGEMYDSPGNAVRGQFSEVNNYLRNISEFFPRDIKNWRKGFISGVDGNIWIETPSNHITSREYLSFKTGAKAVLLEPDLYDMRVGKYTKSADTFAFLGRSELIKEYTFEAGFYYLIGLQRVEITEITDEQIPTIGKQVNILPHDPVVTQKILLAELDELDRGMQKRPHKMMHFSVDDFISPFKDITTNADTYTSIFDNSFFAFLKGRHEEYGIKASMFCFYENTDATFNLSQCTDKFASEFRENGDWLRFGFHAYNASANYNVIDNSTALSHYNAVITQLLRICGGYSSIDQTPRIHFYAGSLSNVRVWKATKGGITGLLSAEDTRNSYYHNSSQTAKLQSDDRLYDEEENIIFFGTDIRLDNDANPYQTLQARKIDPNYRGRMNDLVLFMHDTDTYLTSASRLKRMTDCMDFAVENGYRFAFPMDIANGRES